MGGSQVEEAPKVKDHVFTLRTWETLKSFKKGGDKIKFTF